MNAITATVHNGRLEVAVPADWPEGAEVRIEPIPRGEIRGMTEEEQGDDTESINRWIATFEAIPPLPMTPAEEADMLAWRKKVKDYTIEAVRRQMAGEGTE
jgi:hypothetical protein